RGRAPGRVGAAAERPDAGQVEPPGIGFDEYEVKGTGFHAPTFAAGEACAREATARCPGAAGPPRGAGRASRVDQRGLQFSARGLVGKSTLTARPRSVCSPTRRATLAAAAPGSLHSVCT